MIRSSGPTQPEPGFWVRKVAETATKRTQICSGRIAQVEQTGEEIVIRRHNVPVAKLVPFRPVVAPRVLGGWEGQVVIHDDFDELPSEVAAAFAGELP